MSQNSLQIQTDQPNSQKVYLKSQEAANDVNGSLHLLSELMGQESSSRFQTFCWSLCLNICLWRILSALCPHPFLGYLEGPAASFIFTTSTFIVALILAIPLDVILKESKRENFLQERKSRLIDAISPTSITQMLPQETLIKIQENLTKQDSQLFSEKDLEVHQIASGVAHIVLTTIIAGTYFLSNMPEGILNALTHAVFSGFFSSAALYGNTKLFQKLKDHLKLLSLASEVHNLIENKTEGIQASLKNKLILSTKQVSQAQKKLRYFTWFYATAMVTLMFVFFSMTWFISAQVLYEITGDPGKSASLAGIIAFIAIFIKYFMKLLARDYLLAGYRKSLLWNGWTASEAKAFYGMHLSKSSQKMRQVLFALIIALSSIDFMIIIMQKRAMGYSDSVDSSNFLSLIILMFAVIGAVIMGFFATKREKMVIFKNHLCSEDIHLPEEHVLHTAQKIESKVHSPLTTPTPLVGLDSNEAVIHFWDSNRDNGGSR